MPARAAEPSRQRLLMDYGWKFTRGDAKGAEAPGLRRLRLAGPEPAP